MTNGGSIFRLPRRRQQICLAVLLSLVLWLPALSRPAAAQGDLALTNATLRLEPEFDDPGLLVILAGDFATGPTFPQDVSIPLPSGARGVVSAYQDANGQLLLVNGSRQENGRLLYTLPVGNLWVEYYVDQPAVTGVRNITYTFEAPYAVQNLQIEVQQPARSSDFSMSPQSASSYQGSDGLTYHQVNRQNVAAGEKIPVTISYTKSDQSLSSPGPAAASQQTAPQPAGTSSQGNTLPWLFIGLGVGALVVAGTYAVLVYVRPTGRSSVHAAALARGGHAASRARGQGSGSPGDGAAYCRKCGRKFGAGDQFCGNCGSPRA